MKSGNLNFLEPSGPLQACNGTDLPLPLHYVLSVTHMSFTQELLERKVKILMHLINFLLKKMEYLTSKFPLTIYRVSLVKLTIGFQNISIRIVF